MAEAPNPAQIAPGAEVGDIPLDTPYAGYRPFEHIGYPLNGSFAQGVQDAKGQ